MESAEKQFLYLSGRRREGEGVQAFRCQVNEEGLRLWLILNVERLFLDGGVR